MTKSATTDKGVKNTAKPKPAPSSSSAPKRKRAPKPAPKRPEHDPAACHVTAPCEACQLAAAGK